MRGLKIIKKRFHWYTQICSCSQLFLQIVESKNKIHYSDNNHWLKAIKLVLIYMKPKQTVPHWILIPKLIPLFSLSFAKLLEHITFVDTPGVLSGEKQRTQRSYDFTGVTSWFAAKCDLILLLFDPHKLDISDEFKRVISSLRGHDDKIRVVLNKADQIDTQQVTAIHALTSGFTSNF